VPDPAAVRIGSGGATLNALVVLAQKLCARKGLAYIDLDFMRTQRVLLLHSGGDSRRIPTASVRGKAFCSLPSCSHSEQELLAPIDFLIQSMYSLAENAPPGGFFVAATDVLLLMSPQDISSMKWNDSGITCLGIPADVEFGPGHGVFHLKGDKVVKVYQKASISELEKNGAVIEGRQVLLDSGVVYFSAKAASKLLELHEKPPLDCCTHLGLDHGSYPLRFELYTDLLMSFGSCLSYEEFLKIESDEPNIDRVVATRQIFWQAFHDQGLYCAIATKGKFGHLGTTKEYMEIASKPSVFRDAFHLKEQVRALIDYPNNCIGSVVINSLLSGMGFAEEGSLVEHSELKGNWRIRKGALCSGIRRLHGLQVNPDIVVQEIDLVRDHLVQMFGKSSDSMSEIPEHPWVLLVFGKYDDVKGDVSKATSTFVNRPWSEFLDSMGVSKSDVWAQSSGSCSLWNAKLFPILGDNERADVFTLWMQHQFKPSLHTLRRWRNMRRISFQDALTVADPVAEFRWRESLGFSLDLVTIENILLNREARSLQPLLRRCIHKIDELLSTLDSVASDAPIDIAARCLVAIADVLTMRQGTNLYIRSGPSRNMAWRSAFDELLNGDQREAVRRLKVQRSKWIEEPELAVRAARHYEGAAQIMIRKIVQATSIDPDVSLFLAPAKSEENWNEISLPARIDLSGGWSDTLPISFEHGGNVVNVAVTIDGFKPIGARARRISEKICIFRQIPFHSGSSSIVTTCSLLSHFEDYSHPLASAALVKCCVIALGLVDVTPGTASSLEHQLSRNVQGGLEVEMWSNLPQGSGLGTSSILASALLMAISGAVNRSYSELKITNLTLLVEQLLTTGGGWQDQVGGIFMGFKQTSCQKGLPLRIVPKIIPVSDAIREKFSDHCLLIYTGVARLARYLLQNVLRRWHQRDNDLVDLFKDLCSNSDDMSRALSVGDISLVGKLLEIYWNQKKVIAEGSDVEPPRVSSMMSKIRTSDLSHGMSLVGAGGGGFLVVITKKPALECLSEFKKLLEEEVSTGASFHLVKVAL
jgi:fucokinase